MNYIVDEFNLKQQEVIRKKIYYNFIISSEGGKEIKNRKHDRK